MTPTEIENAVGFAVHALNWRARYFDALLTEPELALVFCHRREYFRRALISLARSGNEDAHLCLCDMAEFLTEIGEPLPLWLQEHVVLFSLGGEQRYERGRSAAQNLIRDAVIGQAVQMVADKFQLRPTRNQATLTECGCSIVSRALAHSVDACMTEANVMAIWRRTVGREVHLCLVIDGWGDVPLIGAY